MTMADLLKKELQTHGARKAELIGKNRGKFALIKDADVLGRIEFIVERFYEPTKKPVDSDWGIKILHPNRPIEKCIVLYNNTQLPWWDDDEPYYERRFVVMGGGNVRIPKAIQKEGVEIRIQNGKKTLKKVKFEDLHKAKP